MSTDFRLPGVCPLLCQMDHEDNTHVLRNTPQDCNLIEDMLPMMNEKARADVRASAANSSASTTPEDSDIIVDMLPMLCATPISVCRRLVLQQAIEALGFSMHETTTHDDESNEILTAIRIDVPPHIHVARMKTRIFYGDWCLTTDASIQSACFNALVYLQKVEVLTIDGIHSADLNKCRKELLRATCWADAYEQRADKLQLTLAAMVKEKTPVLDISKIPKEVHIIQGCSNAEKHAKGHLSATSSPIHLCQGKGKAAQLADEVLQKAKDFTETDEVIKDKIFDKQSTIGPAPLATDKKLKLQCDSNSVCTVEETYTEEHLLAPSGSTSVTQNVGNKEIPGGMPFISLTNSPFIFPPDLLEFLRRKRRIIRLPDPIPAHAASKRKERKQVIDMQRARKKTAALPNLHLLDGSSSENLVSAVNDLTNHDDYTIPDHIHLGCILPGLTTPPSVNKPTTLSKSSVLTDSKVRKPLFEDGDKGKTTELEGEVLERTIDFAETYEVVSASSKQDNP